MVKFHIDFDDKELEKIFDTITKDLTEEERKLVQSITTKFVDKSIKELQALKEYFEKPTKFPDLPTLPLKKRCPECGALLLKRQLPSEKTVAYCTNCGDQSESSQH